MFRTILSYFFVLTVAASIIIAQDQVKVVKIDLTDNSKLDKIESLELMVIDLTKDYLYSVVSEKQAEQLTQADINFNELSRLINAEELYLYSSDKKASTDKISAQNKVKISDKLVLGTSNSELYEISGIKKIKLADLSRTFKNIKTRYNKIQSDELDSLISSFTSLVDSNSVRGYIQGLQDFGTRFLRHQNRKVVALWIKNQFELMGYTDVELDSFEVSGLMQYNVVATYPAAEPSDQFIVIGGHHDSITNQSLSNTEAPAPGADDNASGTTAVLESARVIMENNFQSEVNLKFVTFAAEELGLYGGYDYARKAASTDMNIKLMINHDMISSTRRGLLSSIVDINNYSGSDAFSQLAYQNVEKFTIINPDYGSQNSSGSDSYAFYQNGFNAVYFEESDFSSYYHTSEDLINHYSMSFCSEVIKASVATLISASIAPAMVSDFNVADVGDGSSLLLEWSANGEVDLTAYKIYVGTEEGNYSNEYETTNLTYTLTGLTEGTMYYVGISAIDAYGYESFIVERSKIPNAIPSSPLGFEVHSGWQSVVINWLPNEELDIAGYNVYRSGVDTDDITKLNSQLITETEFVDNTVQSGVFYEYQVKAEDNDQNESQNTEFLISRGVTLDQGILLVDETDDGDGSLFSPTDEEVDEFYANKLLDYNFVQFDMKTLGKINLADLGAYEVVLWYGDDKTEQSAVEYTDAIREYLDYGGKFLYSGFRPSKTFEGATGLNQLFSEGDFLYDCFKISGVNYSLLAKFGSAYNSNPEYPELNLNDEISASSSDGQISGIEAFTLADSTTEIYEYNSTYEPNVPQGALSNKTVGTGYYGEDFSAVVLSFPLSYMQDEEVEAFLDLVLSQKFGLTTDVKENEDVVPSQFSLYQNYPNPFNPTTTIKFSIPTKIDVRVKVYDILGREVANLVDQEMAAGSYSVKFDGTSLASGIYFYSLTAGDYSEVKKLMLLK